LAQHDADPLARSRSVLTCAVVEPADAGRPFWGRYELVRRLDRGGMGEVFLARSRGAERVHKLVVVKRIRSERAGDQAARARFIDEARVAVSLSHPHIVPVFEFGELDGEYFLVMEWLRGGALARVAGVDRPPLGWAAVAEVGSQLCDALAYVHARADRRGRRLVHGDVTPRNILLSGDGHALITDFGLARFAAHGGAGTARYRAPEQARGEAVDARADLYALALVLCEAATGQPAYDRDPERAAAQSRVGIVPALDGCDPQLATLLRHALAARPEDRFADAGALRDAFEALLDREPRARASGRAELVGRVAAAGADESTPSESRIDRSALATREATRAPGRRSLAGGLVALGLVVGAALASIRSASRPTPLSSSAPAAAPSPPPSLSARAPSSPTVVASAPAPAPAPRRAPVVPAAAPASALLDVNATPWAHVRIDGRDRGETPLLGLSLAPGTHEVELVNEPLGARRVFPVALRPGEHARRIEDLRRPAP
jgi:serine/threonine-protein kinase